jgi:hypothetical protein
MTKFEIKYSKQTRRVDSLRLHEILETIGFVPPDKMYKAELKYLGIYKEIVVTKDGRCLNMPDILLAAIEMKVEYVNVLVIETESEHAWLRLINFDNRHIYRGSKTTLYKIIKLLQNHLWNDNEGRAWYNELPGDGINEKIGALVGYSPSTISNIKYIGDNDITYLEKVDDPEFDMNLAQAKILVDSEKKMNTKNDNYSGQEISSFGEGCGDQTPVNDNNQTDGEVSDPTAGNTNGNGAITGEHPSEPGNKKPKRRKSAKKAKPKEAVETDELTSFSVGYKKSGEYTLDFADDVPMIIHNGEPVGGVYIEPGGNNNVNEELRYVLLSKDNKWSFHIIATRINNIIKQKEVESNNE